MLKTKEVISILLAIILFAFVIWFFKDTRLILPSFVIAAVVILTNIVAKKIAARYFHSEAEVSIWQFQRWGYYQRSHFKTPKPIGLILPFLLVFASAPEGAIKMLTFLQTEITVTIKRISKKRGGLNRYYELTEWHNGLIVAYGILANVAVVAIPYIFGRYELLLDIAKYSIYYAIWNMLPIGQLDGTKVFFINWKFWVFIYALVFVGVAFLIAL